MVKLGKEFGNWVWPETSEDFVILFSADSMIDAGVDEGDILVIDRSLDPDEGDMCVCFVDGEFTLKHLHSEGGRLRLVPANDRYPVIEITEGMDFKMWGVVTYVIKKVR